MLPELQHFLDQRFKPTHFKPVKNSCFSLYQRPILLKPLFDGFSSILHPNKGVLRVFGGRRVYLEDKKKIPIEWQRC